MNKIFLKIISFLIIALIIQSCSFSPQKKQNNIKDNLNQETSKNKFSILTMTDLEIIKKTSDFLKAKGAEVKFEESEISLLNNADKEYLEVRLYPSTSDPTKYYLVYIDQSGDIIEYSIKN